MAGMVPLTHATSTSLADKKVGLLSWNHMTITYMVVSDWLHNQVDGFTTSITTFGMFKYFTSILLQ